MRSHILVDDGNVASVMVVVAILIVEAMHTTIASRSATLITPLIVPITHGASIP